MGCKTYDKIAHDPSTDVGDSKLALSKVVTLEKHWRLSITQQSSETNKILRNLASLQINMLIATQTATIKRTT